jgi:ectoine hydroxylase-related dioxygenase (phytanoyl-CoA dioxygenase family)
MRFIDRMRRKRRVRQDAGPGHSVDLARALKKARTLADAGRYNEAIGYLTAENRRHRCREIDKMLLALRSEGFLEQDWNIPSPEWPTSVPARFDGDGIPNINADQLDASAIRSGIEHRGSLIVRGLLDSNQVETLRNDIDRVMAAFDAVASGSVDSETEGWFEPFSRDGITKRDEKRSKGAMMTADSPPAVFDLLEVFEATGLSAAIREFFGEPPLLLSRKLTLRCVSPGVSNGGWHQDGGFLGESIRSLNVWLALTDCGVDAPGIDIIAKRLDGIVEPGSGYAKWATNPYAAAIVGEGCTERPEFKAGDAIIFDHLCLHRTAGDPKMTKTRYAIETWLMAPSTYDKQGAPILF